MAFSQQQFSQNVEAQMFDKVQNTLLKCACKKVFVAAH